MRFGFSREFSVCMDTSLSDKLTASPPKCSPDKRPTRKPLMSDLPERRTETAMLLALVQQVHDDVRSLTLALESHVRVEDIVIAELKASIDKYMVKQNEIERAFLKAHDGTIDYHGHYEDHSTRKTISAWLARARNNAMMKIIEYGSLTFVCWLAYEIWTTLLRGPK